MRAPVALAAGALLLCGCYSLEVKHGRLVPERGAPREQWHHDALYGVVELSPPVAVDEACPTDFAVVHSEIGFLNMVIGYFTAGLWDPFTIGITCAAGAQRQLKIAVLGLTPRAGVDPQLAALATDGLIAELRKRPGLRVLGQADIAAIIGLERQREMLGCAEQASCLAEIADALGADRMIHGTVGRVGGALVFYLSSVDPKRARAVGSSTARLKSGDDSFFDALPGMANDLLAETPETSAPAAPQTH